MRRIKSVVVAAAFIAVSIPAFSTGVPVFNAQEAIQLAQQLQTMGEQLDQLKKQYATVVGSYGRGAEGLAGAINSSAVVPGSWQDVVAQQKNGTYANLQSTYGQVMNALSPSSFSNSNQGANYKLNTDATLAGLSVSEALYNESQTHLQNFQTLAQQVDTTQNVKDAADLQNRMTAELGMAQAAQTKLQALTARLSASQLNGSNQADAARAKFFGQTQQGASQ
ncbi:type IV secretion system family protein [Caballeronia calidae]|uniref:Type IV secretion system family protein n=1 Tax=Caballeronia calidae TaxID=1777139 RepID=A0A158EE97_9BURK|nr:type IV secretion system protein [Caballeronia calidae]SAL05222.1 type IV secretion system family protein [Caballeronia calidae]